jgi:VanZ family protein
MKSWIYRWGPAILVMTIIFVASDTPGSSLPEFGYCDLLAKKGGHMLGYALLAASYYRAFGRKQHTPRRRFLLALGLTIFYAALDEYHQTFTPGRNASPIDVAIDTLGGLVGIAMIQWIQRRFSRNPEIRKRKTA